MIDCRGWNKVGVNDRTEGKKGKKDAPGVIDCRRRKKVRINDKTLK